MIFQQSAAPTGWTKQTAINDYGLRVTNGAVGVTSGVAFSTVFAQTAVGSTTITQSTSPSHVHGGIPTSTGVQANAPPGATVYAGNSGNTNSVGGDQSHGHSI